MKQGLRDWVGICLLLGAVLALGGGFLTRSLPADERSGAIIAAASGVVLVAFVLVVARLSRRFGNVLGDEDAEEIDLPARVSSQPQTTLFLASFVALFLEMVLIRYTGSQIRIFSFYKNVPLISAYLGLGLGCALGRGRPRQLLWLLLWFVPLAVFLSQGAFLFSGALGRIAAAASSEHVLGDAVVKTPGGVQTAAGQFVIGIFCVVTLFAFASFFIPIGRLLGDAFERLPRLKAYTINIVGSLAGTGVFLLMGYFWAPPWVWILVGLTPLLWWIEDRRLTLVAGALIAFSTLAVAPSVGETIWSPYQKLVGHQILFKHEGVDAPMPGYLVDISDVFYQIAVDLRPEAIARVGKNPFPHYSAAFESLPHPPGHVLIVGAGTGNDVAAALRAGATRVDAVDIDPAIVSMGRRHHPEKPYDDPRVRVIVDDARAAFRRLPAGEYDVVIFGLLDSHTQLGMSSLRLDNYVFTRESFSEARRLLRPGGSIVVTAATFREWFRQRFLNMLKATCDSPVQATTNYLWVTYACQVNGSVSTPAYDATDGELPSDDWPFLYLPERSIPVSYAVVVLLLMVASVLVVRVNGLSPQRFTTYHGHLFFLGAAFLLMEMYAINRLALLFGTTWIVSAVTIMLVLALIVAANLTVATVTDLGYPIAYAGLAVSLMLSFSLDPQAVLGRGIGLSILYGLVVLLPVYFAGLVFARSFARAVEAGPALGANMLGAVLGGWAEYASMAVGIRALALVALGFYLGSLLCLLSAARPAAKPSVA